MEILTSNDVKKVVSSIEKEWNVGIEKIIVKLGRTSDFSKKTLKFYVKRCDEEIITRISSFETCVSWPALDLVFEEAGFAGNHISGYEKIV